MLMVLLWWCVTTAAASLPPPQRSGDACPGVYEPLVSVLESLGPPSPCVQLVVAGGGPTVARVSRLVHRHSAATVLVAGGPRSTHCDVCVYAAASCERLHHVLKGSRFRAEQRVLLAVGGSCPLPQWGWRRGAAAVLLLACDGPPQAWSPAQQRSPSPWRRALGPARRRTPDLRGARLVASTFTFPPFSIYDNATGAVGGVEMLIWSEAARRLNCSFSVLEPDVDNRYGFPSTNGSFSGGITAFVADGVADVGFASIWITPETVKRLETAPVWTQVCATFLVRRPRPLLGQLSALWRPLQPAVWAAVALCLLLHAAAVALLRERRARVSSALVSSVAGLLGQPSASPASTAGRLVSLAWRLCGMLLATAFCSALVGSLAAPAYEAPIDSVRDMLRHGLSWGNVYPQPLAVYLDLQKPAHAQWALRWRQEQAGARLPLVQTGGYAVPAVALGGQVFVEGPPLDELTMAGLRRIAECTCNVYVAHLLPRDSPLLEPFSSLVLRMLSSGLVDLWQRRETAQAQRTEAAIATAAPRRQTLKALQSAFLLAAVGLCAAAAVFCAELMVAVCRRRRHSWAATQAHRASSITT